MLILTIFNMSDPLERVIKIDTKVDKCIYTGSMTFYLCVSFGDDWTYWMMIEGSKKYQKASFGPFLISWLPGLDEKVIWKCKKLVTRPHVLDLLI